MSSPVVITEKTNAKLVIAQSPSPVLVVAPAPGRPNVVELIAPGPQGPQGDPGPGGQGVPIGGDTGQILSKTSPDDYDTAWTTNDLGNLSGVTITGPVADQSIVLFDTDSNEWKNKQLVAGTGIALDETADKLTVTATSPASYSLAQLTDVSLDPPLGDGNVLSYTTSVSKWQNLDKVNLTDGGNF